MADTILRMNCPECEKSLMVEEAEVHEQTLTCPHCEADVDVDAEEEDQTDGEEDDQGDRGD